MVQQHYFSFWSCLLAASICNHFVENHRQRMAVLSVMTRMWHAWSNYRLFIFVSYKYSEFVDFPRSSKHVQSIPYLNSIIYTCDCAFLFFWTARVEDIAFSFFSTSSTLLSRFGLAFQFVKWLPQGNCATTSTTSCSHCFASQVAVFSITYNGFSLC